MRKLILVGCGGLARETVDLVHDANVAGAGWALEGFVDDDPAKHGKTISGLPVLGPTEMLDERPDTAVALCVGNPHNPHSRTDVANRLALPASRYATLVHPSAAIGRSCTIGYGGIVLAGVVATADVWVGSHVVIMPATVLTHDDVIGDGATIASGVRVSGSVHVGPAAYLGAGAVVREGVRIGAGAVLGAASLALRDIPDGEVWAGVPAHPLRPRE